MGCLKFRVRSKCTPMYFVAFWNTGACQWTRSAPDSLLSRLQNRPFRLTNDLLQRHPQQTFSFDWRIYSVMHCWAKWWVGLYLVVVCSSGENLSQPYIPAPDILLNISPQLVYIAAGCSTKQCGCRKHWLACKRACGNCQDGDCDSVYCVLRQFPRIMDMKPKTLSQVVLTGYALCYDRNTHLGTSTGFTSDVIKQSSEAKRYSQEHY